MGGGECGELGFDSSEIRSSAVRETFARDGLFAAEKPDLGLAGEVGGFLNVGVRGLGLVGNVRAATPSSASFGGGTPALGAVAFVTGEALVASMVPIAAAASATRGDDFAAPLPFADDR